MFDSPISQTYTVSIYIYIAVVRRQGMLLNFTQSGGMVTPRPTPPQLSFGVSRAGTASTSSGTLAAIGHPTHL